MDLDYLFITSNDPIGKAGVGEASELALRLAESGKRVGVFLIQNGVVPARRGARWDALDATTVNLQHRPYVNLNDS